MNTENNGKEHYTNKALPRMRLPGAKGIITPPLQNVICFLVFCEILGSHAKISFRDLMSAQLPHVMTNRTSHHFCHFLSPSLVSNMILVL